MLVKIITITHRRHYAYTSCATDHKHTSHERGKNLIHPNKVWIKRTQKKKYGCEEEKTAKYFCISII